VQVPLIAVVTPVHQRLAVKFHVVVILSPIVQVFELARRRRGRESPLFVALSCTSAAQVNTITATEGNAPVTCAVACAVEALCAAFVDAMVAIAVALLVSIYKQYSLNWGGAKHRRLLESQGAAVTAAGGAQPFRLARDRVVDVEALQHGSQITEFEVSSQTWQFLGEKFRSFGGYSLEGSTVFR
jgi:hypothetical protein